MSTNDPVALFQQLKVALSDRNRAGTNQIIGRLLEVKPKLGQKWKTIAAIAKTNGEVNFANLAMKLYADAFGNSDQVIFERAAVFAQTGRIVEADGLLRSISDAIPSEAENAYIRGTIAANFGRFDEARDYLRRSIEAMPGSGQSMMALAILGKISDSDAQRIENAKSMMSGSDIPRTERASYLYALGKLHVERNRSDEAGSALAEGACLMQAERPYNENADQLSAASASEGWTGETIGQVARTVDIGNSGRSIFVTGLPRTGTTLVEQILATHSAVGGGEELGLFRLLEQDIGGKSKKHFDEFVALGGSAMQIRDLYYHLLGERHPGSLKFVDKSLNASRYMALVAGVFPESPIIWVRRNPLDCAWSAYRTWFLKGINWSWSLPAMAAHFKLEDNLFNYWLQELGERILVVEYEDLVRQPAEQITRITQHCGLALEQDQLSPHITERTVTTASVSQVRQPINAKGIESSKPYRDLLDPFIRNYF